MSNDVKLPHLLSTNRTSKQGTTQPGHLVGNWVQKRSDSRYGAGHGRGQYGFEPFTPTLPSKTPGRKFQTAPTGVGIPSPPAPYRRFAAFSVEKNDNMPPRSRNMQPESPGAPQNRSAHVEAPPRRKSATPTQSPASPHRDPKNPRRRRHLGFECSIIDKKIGSSATAVISHKTYPGNSPR